MGQRATIIDVVGQSNFYTHRITRYVSVLLNKIRIILLSLRCTSKRIYLTVRADTVLILLGGQLSSQVMNVYKK